MKRILVPTDFSQQAEQALKVAVQIASQNDSEIFLHHSMEMPLHLANSNTGELPEALFFIKLAEKEFEELFKKPYLKEVKIQESIGHGEIYEDIQTSVKNNNIDLIVMGSHGASGFREMFIGSNTEKVVRTSKIPVLVIKNEHRDFKVKDFVFATDFSKECKKPFQQALQFAQGLDAHLHLLYVNTPTGFKTSSEAKQMMNDFTKGVDPERISLHVYNETAVEKGILEFAKEHNMQLIGMSTHGRKGIAHFFNGSISEDLVNHANRPVITFRIS